MKKILFSTLFVGLLFMSGCGNTLPVVPGATPTDPLASVSQAVQQIGTFTVADLTAADADAVLHNDAIAHACYPALIKFVQSSPLSATNTTVVGAFTAFQAARDVTNTVQSFQVPDYLKLGCAPLVMDVQNFIVRLAAIGGGAAVGAPGVSALLPH